jgi:NAD(P)-dependent dehydrogenase (short-subunit alcohol dehydrogenase family)
MSSTVTPTPLRSTLFQRKRNSQEENKNSTTHLVSDSVSASSASRLPKRTQRRSTSTLSSIRWSIALTLAALILFAGRIWFIGGVNNYTRDLCGHVVLITGSNTGLGFEMARELLKMDATVILVGRDEARVNAAAERLAPVVAASASKCARLDASLLLDLASLTSVRTFAAAVLERYKRLDILCLNAGVMKVPRGKTVDGHEITLQVNHLGHHLLTHLLAPVLAKTAAMTGDARVLSVSSAGHMWGDLSGEALFDLSFERRADEQQGFAPYTQSKLCNVLFASELARRAPQGVFSFSLHPGAVQTEIFRNIPVFAVAEPYLAPLLSYFFKTPLQGAQTQIYLATVPLAEVRPQNGKYFGDCAVMNNINPQAKNVTLANQLWLISNELVGI